MRILFADDEVEVRQEIAKSLKKVGYEVIEVGDGIELLKQLAPQNPNKPDLIITDILIPKLDGHTVANVAKKQLKITTPIIALTAIPPNSIIDISEPFVDILHKPADPHDVLKIILTLTCPNCCNSILSVDYKQHHHFDCKKCHKKYVLQQQDGELVLTEKINLK